METKTSCKGKNRNKHNANTIMGNHERFNTLAREWFPGEMFQIFQMFTQYIGDVEKCRRYKLPKNYQPNSTFRKQHCLTWQTTVNGFVLQYYIPDRALWSRIKSAKYAFYILAQGGRDNVNFLGYDVPDEI